MGLGERIKNWLLSFGLLSAIGDWFEAYKERRANMLARLRTQTRKAFFAGDLQSIFMVALQWVAIVFTGADLWLPEDTDAKLDGVVDELEAFYANPQLWMRQKLNAFGTSPETKAFTEFVGTIITEPVVSLLETYAGSANPDPHAMARSFHGIASGLPWAAETVDSLLRSLLGERAPSVGKNIMALYWGLGLGFLGWQTLAPLLSSGLQPNLERYYNKLYRPERFNASQVRDLFGLGKWDANKVQAYLADQGWRNEDIQTWIDLGYRDLSEGVIWDLFETGQMNQTDVAVRLRALGYNPADIPLVFLAHEKDDTKNAPKNLVSTAKNSFKQHLINEGEFRQILTDLNYSAREIELQVQLITTERETELRELTTSQIRALYQESILGETEVKHNLTELDYSSQNADLLIELWQREVLPKAVRINKSTIAEAFSWGVLDRGKAKNMLQAEAGYTADNAEIILKVEEAKLIGRPDTTQVGAPALSLGLLRQFVNSGLITRDELAARAELARFTPADKEAITELYFAAIGVETTELSDSLLLDAYTFGLVSREDLAARLVARGVSEEDAETAIRITELENPEVFGEFTGRFVRQPSVSQLQLAYQRGLINEDEFRQRLESQGYSLDAIQIYVFNSQYVTPAKPKQLTKTDVLSLYKKDAIDRGEATRRLVELGYTIVDAGLLVQAATEPIENTDVGQAYLNGFIDAGNAAVLLDGLGYTFEEIDDFFAAAGAGL